MELLTRYFLKLSILKITFNAPNIAPVIIAVRKDFKNKRINASLFEKSLSKNP